MPMYRNVRLDLFACMLNDCCPANGLTGTDYKMFDAVFFAHLGNNQGVFSLFFRDAMFHKFSKLKATNIFFMMI